MIHSVINSITYEALHRILIKERKVWPSLTLTPRQCDYRHHATMKHINMTASFRDKEGRYIREIILHSFSFCQCWCNKNESQICNLSTATVHPNPNWTEPRAWPHSRTANQCKITGFFMGLKVNPSPVQWIEITTSKLWEMLSPQSSIRQRAGSSMPQSCKAVGNALTTIFIRQRAGSRYNKLTFLV